MINSNKHQSKSQHQSSPIDHNKNTCRKYFPSPPRARSEQKAPARRLTFRSLLARTLPASPMAAIQSIWCALVHSGHSACLAANLFGTKLEQRQKTLRLARLFGTYKPQLFFASMATKKCGRNRQAKQKSSPGYVRPFDRLLGVRDLWEGEDGLEGAKKKGPSPVFEESPIWSGFLYKVRTCFEGEKGCPG